MVLHRDQSNYVIYIIKSYYYCRLIFNSGLRKESYLSVSSETESPDLIIVCGAHQFPVHKQKLRKVSPIFENIIENLESGVNVDVNNNDFIQKTSALDRVIVDNVSDEIFEKILNFIYHGSVEFADDCVKILRAADYYEVI